ncbi:MAG: YbbR-like domain-containing protein [Acidobacteriia bacterium]|nr:YbbR-like domain-containing protein [Terriglobia bacterium]
MQWLTKNLDWKLASLGLSILFWVALTADPPVITSISVPVQFKNIPTDLEVSSDLLDKVQLEVRGPSGKLTPASLSETSVVLDLASVVRPGEKTFPIQEASIRLPTGVVLEHSTPDQVRLHFEKRTVREVPVEIRFAPPPKGYTVVSSRAEPARLRILGPESRVHEIATVETDRLDLSGVVDAASFSVQAYTSDPHVRFEASGRVRVIIVVRKSDGSEN